MDTIFNFALNLVITLVIYSLVDLILLGTKSSKYAKKCASLAAIIIFLNFFINFEPTPIKNFEINKPDIENDLIWESALEHVEKEFESQIVLMCLSNGLKIDTCTVKLETDYENINIKSIEISGEDKKEAKSLISGNLNIKSAYINTDGEA